MQTKHVSNCEWLNHNALWNSIRPFSFYYLKIFFWVDCILCELPAKMCSCWNSWVLLIRTLFFKFHNNFFFDYNKIIDIMLKGVVFFWISFEFLNTYVNSKYLYLPRICGVYSIPICSFAFLPLTLLSRTIRPLMQVVSIN